jgi:hypothetical protein
MTPFHCLPSAKNCPCEGRRVGGAESKVRLGRQFLELGLGPPLSLSAVHCRPKQKQNYKLPSCQSGGYKFRGRLRFRNQFTNDANQTWTRFHWCVLFSSAVLLLNFNLESDMFPKYMYLHAMKWTDTTSEFRIGAMFVSSEFGRKFHTQRTTVVKICLPNRTSHASPELFVSCGKSH